MTQLFIESFGGTAGQPATGFTALSGSTLLYESGGGAIGQSDATLLRYDSWCGTANARVRTKVAFGSPASTDRTLAVVLIRDASNYYEAYLRTNNNSPPKVAIRKCVAGIVSTLLAETSIPVLSAGVAVTLELYRSGSTLRVLVDDVQYGADQTDAALTANWRPGYKWDVYTSGSWIVDDLEALDHTSEPSATGWVLQVGTRSYDAAALRAANIYLDFLEISYLSPRMLVFAEVCRHTAATFHPEEEVRLLAEGSPRPCDFRGLIKRVRRIGTANGEAVQYECYDPRMQAKYVVPDHPDTSAFSIVWNADEEDDDYDADYADQTVGEILKWYFDTFANELREAKAAPNGTMYVSTDFDTMTVKPTKLNLRGDFETIIQTLLSFQPTHVCFVDASTGKWRFVDWTGHTAKDLSFTTANGHVPQNEVDDDSTACYTAVKVRSVRKEKQAFHFSTTDDSIEEDWDKDLEKHWSPSRGNRSSIPGTVASVPAANTVEIALSYAKDEVFTNEWEGTTLRFTSGVAYEDAYTVSSNTASVDGKFTVVLTANLVDTPLAGDGCEVTDDDQYATTTSKNGFKKVFRQFRIADFNKQNLVKKDCTTGLWVKPIDDYSLRTVRQPVKIEFSATAGVIATGLPIVLSGTDTGGAGCNTPGDYEAADFELEGEYWEDVVLERRFPTTGWYGTAYSTDVSRWSGGGPPAPGDWGVMREKVMEEPYYLESSQNAAIDALLEEWLKAHCNKPFQGRHVYLGTGTDHVDRDFVNLQKAVTFSSAGRTTGWESGVYIFAHTARFNFAAKQMELELGNVPSFGGFEYDQLREAAVSGSLRGDYERIVQDLKQQQECRRDAKPKLEGASPGPLCGSDVRVRVRDRSTSVTTIIKQIEERIRILEKNKEDVEEVTPGSEEPPVSEPEVPVPNGVRTYVKDSAGSFFTVDGDGNWRAVTASGGAPTLDADGNLQLGDVSEPVRGGIVHKHVEATESLIWTGTEDTWALPFTPALSDPPLVFLQDGGAGDFKYQLRNTHYTITGSSLVFVTPPSAASVVKIHAEVSTYKVGRNCRARFGLRKTVYAIYAARFAIA